MRIVASAVQRSEVGLSKPGRPRSVLLFLGPTGVGKTETVLLVARALYGSDKAVARFDMGEYAHEDSLLRLLGESSKDAGLLPTAIKNSPNGGILLLDEIEKAHPKIAKVFLAATDAARVTGSDGQTESLEKWYVVFTSNLGSSNAVKMSNVPYSMLSRTVMDAAVKFFAPEVLARFQHKIVFNSLPYVVQKQIAADMIHKESSYLAAKASERSKRPITISYKDDVLNFIVRKGFSKDMGARAMRNTIEEQFGEPLSQWLMQGDFPEGNLHLCFDAPPLHVALRLSVTVE